MRKSPSSVPAARVVTPVLALTVLICTGGIAAYLLLRPAAQASSNTQAKGPARSEATTEDGPVSTNPAQDALVHTATIQLIEGKLDVGELLAQLAEPCGLDAESVRANVNWKIDVNSPAGQLTLNGIQSITRGVVTFDIQDDHLDLAFDQLKLRNEEKQIRGAILMFLKRFAPEAAARAEARYGFFIHREDGSTVSPSVENLSKFAIVLVHGLDDPGKVWNVLAPTLVAEGYTTCEFFYPNDQAIDRSADLLVEHLATLRKLGVRRVAIVAHSMGGLVSRWALTDARGYNGMPAGHEALPDVVRLIMVGTPNHGSKMARFRLAGEIREQIERTLSGDGMLFGSIFDGTGAAKIDLLPESTFLTTLNGRAHPASLPSTIIAGNTSPATPTQIHRLKPYIQQKIGPQASQPAGDLMESLAEVSEGIGDGVVSLESARLKGVEDYVTVAANHLSMIRNYSTSSERVPPAVPIILERLQSGSQPAP